MRDSQERRSPHNGHPRISIEAQRDPAASHAVLRSCAAPHKAPTSMPLPQGQRGTPSPCRHRRLCSAYAFCYRARQQGSDLRQALRRSIEPRAPRSRRFPHRATTACCPRRPRRHTSPRKSRLRGLRSRAKAAGSSASSAQHCRARCPPHYDT